MYADCLSAKSLKFYQIYQIFKGYFCFYDPHFIRHFIFEWLESWLVFWPPKWRGFRLIVGFNTKGKLRVRADPWGNLEVLDTNFPNCEHELFGLTSALKCDY